MKDEETVAPERMVWSKKLSVGIEWIDIDHQQLIEIFNRCGKITARIDAKGVVEDILDELGDYVREHFAREEALMKACNYSNMEDHMQRHAEMIKHLGDMRDEFSKGQLARSDLVRFLTEWLIDHIGGTDRELAEYCKQNPESIEKVTQQINASLNR